jgi:hypothetical protein
MSFRSTRLYYSLLAAEKSLWNTGQIFFYFYAALDEISDPHMFPDPAVELKAEIYR